MEQTLKQQPIEHLKANSKMRQGNSLIWLFTETKLISTCFGKGYSLEQISCEQNQDVASGSSY